MNVLVDEASLAGIANAIREKSSSEATYKPSEMAQAVRNIPTSSSSLEVPKTHYNEAMSLIDKIRDIQREHNTVTFGVVSDNHINIGGDYEAPTKKSFQHGCFALDEIGSLCCDFVANLGDNQWQNNIDTDLAMANMNFCNQTMQSFLSQLRLYRLVGNHDQSSVFGKPYDNIGVYNEFDNCAETKERGYGYFELTDKKLRVICLNTSDYYNATGGYGMSYEQKKWLAESLDLSAKADSSCWKILLLSHIPLDYPESDYNTSADIQAILKAYVKGINVSISVNSSYATAEHDTVTASFSYNYSGKNNAKIIANIHGHIHNLCYGKMTDNDIVRMSSANTCFKLEKSKSYGGGMYDTDTAYPKTDGTAQDTAVTFYCVDLDNEIIYSFVFGAGIDRTVTYKEAKLYTISYNLAHCFSNTSLSSVVENNSYSTVITSEADYSLQSVTVLMGGKDITSTAYKNGTISIGSVTGDIVITATATVPQWDYTVPDIAAAPRSNWEVAASGADSSTITLANANTQIAVGVTTPNNYAYTDRENKPVYLMPVPDKATKVQVSTTDTNGQTIRIRGIKFNSSGGYTRVFDTGWVSDFSKSFTKGSADFITVALNYTSGTSIAWGYNDSQISVKFTNY